MKKIIMICWVIGVLLLMTVSAEVSNGDELVTRMDAIYSFSSLLEWDMMEYTESLKIVSKYSDVEEPRKLNGAMTIATAIEYGIINGYEDNTLRVDAPVTRAEYATMLYRCDTLFTDKQIVLVDVVPDYNDVSDWNREAIEYVMQRGLMIGYGASFGTDDYITKNQLEIIKDRIKNGLLSIDKYNLYTLCGTCPLNMEKVLESQYDAKLYFDSEDLKESQWLDAVGSASSQELFYQIERWMFGDFDWREYQIGTNKKTSKIWNLMEVEPWGMEYLPGYRANVYWWNDDDVKIQAVKHSLCVFSLESSYYKLLERMPVRFQGTKGYEYFTYTEGKVEELPDSIELGKWYRRVVQIHYIHKSATMSYGILSVDFGEPELLPEEFLTGYTM